MEAQVFNPSFVPASPATGGQQGLLIRTQNCTVNPGDACAFCGGDQQKASVITFAKLVRYRFPECVRGSTRTDAVAG